MVIDSATKSVDIKASSSSPHRVCLIRHEGSPMNLASGTRTETVYMRKQSPSKVEASLLVPNAASPGGPRAAFQRMCRQCFSHRSVLYNVQRTVCIRFAY